MRKTAIVVGLALGLFFIVRAVAEPFVIDMSDPATYRNDWGGPSLLGVLLVHCGPGVLAAIAIAMALGAAIAKDPDVGECAVARMWNFTMSKEDIVSDLATVPAAVLKPYLAEFESNGQNLKKTLRAMLTSEDFTHF